MPITLSPMTRALELARLAAEAGEVPVGAVIVDPATGMIVGEGANAPVMGHDPTAHAEIIALRSAAAKRGNYRLTDLHLYVTLEPCAMCAGAISLARIGKVVFAASDPKGGAILHGARFFEHKTCHWRPAVEQDESNAVEAGDILRDFFRERRK